MADDANVMQLPTASRPIGERVAVLEIQMVEVKDDVKEIKDGLSHLTKSAWGLVVAICAWALIQLYMTTVRTNHPEQVPPPAISQSHTNG